MTHAAVWTGASAPAAGVGAPGDLYTDGTQVYRKTDADDWVLWSGYLDVTPQMFGAAGDGVTDDTTAILAAIDAVGAANGGTVRLPAGVYMVSAPLPLPGFTSLRGAGPFATILRAAGSSDIVTCVPGAELIGVHDLQIDSQAPRTAGSGIAFTQCTGYVIDNVRFVDTYNLGTFNDVSAGWLSRLKVAHNHGAINRGFWWQSSVDTHIRDVLIDGGTVNLPAGNAWFQADSGCDTFEMNGVSAGAPSGSGTGLYLSHTLAPGSFAPRWVKITDFWFEGAHSGVQGQNALTIDNALSAYFVNGYLTSSSVGAYVGGGRDIKLTDVILQNNWEQGAVISGAAGPFDVHFADCTFDSNSQGANDHVAHLYLGGDASNVRVRDTVFSSEGLNRANQPDYAIECAVAAAQGVRVSGCRFEAYGTAVIGGSQGASGMVLRDNTGYNPVGHVTSPAMPASGSAYANAFGVDCTVCITGGTVSTVAIGGSPTGLTAGAFRVAALQTITLAYSAAPAWTWFGD